MSWFGDDDPEDAWHPDDPIPQLLRNLYRRFQLVEAARAAGEWNTAAVRYRLDLIHVDLSHVLDRIGPAD